MLDTVSLKKFEDYLRYERNSSDNTIASYMRDMRQLSEYLDSHDMSNLIDASEKELNSSPRACARTPAAPSARAYSCI